MRLSGLTSAAMLLTGACATTPQASIEDRTLSFGCNDTVVVGRIENGAYRPVKSENDPLGHGWISATLKVKRVVRGSSVPVVLPVEYFAHEYLRSDRDFMFVLRRTPSGYRISTAQLMWLRPRLASQCG